ncbi:MAG: enoyl-CoA hydratase-related protein [Thermoanaerobaculia bacterium]
MSGSAEDYRHLRVAREGPVARVRLARPAVRNAFDETLIAELTRVFLSFVDDAETRVVVLTGDGPIFCAGADVEWMRRAGSFSRTENETDAERMAGMLRAIDTCPRPVIAAAHGAAIGGGVGLLAAADVAFAAEGTVFSLAEVKLGILPSVISPFVIRSIGVRQARRLFLTGTRFDAEEARRIGLVHAVSPADGLEELCRREIEALLSSAPEAVRTAKKLIAEVAGRSPEEAMPLTVRTIAERRASEEAREGLSAFLEKRPPSWAPPRS